MGNGFHGKEGGSIQIIGRTNECKDRGIMKAQPQNHQNGEFNKQSKNNNISIIRRVQENQKSRLVWSSI